MIKYYLIRLAKISTVHNNILDIQNTVQQQKYSNRWMKYHHLKTELMNQVLKRVLMIRVVPMTNQ